MKKYFLAITLIAGLFDTAYSQADIGLSYGKFYALYQSKDDGTGFRNTPKSQYSGYPAINLNIYFSQRFSGEVTASFLPYQQYIGTRLYTPNFFSVMYSINLSATGNYSIFRSDRIESRVKLGLGLGIIPDQYEGKFMELYWNGSSFDSIARGGIRRDFTPVFPTICLGADFYYSVSKSFKVGIGFTSQTGFIRITEYDIYYNDGSGNNDQHARQWGKGSFYSFYGGVRYILKKK